MNHGRFGTARVCHRVYGAVQGVGFRPWVYRMARQCGLTGWVANDRGGVCLEVEGADVAVQEFCARLRTPPWPISIHSIESSWLPTVGYRRFEIRPSEAAGPGVGMVMPDIAVCADCLRELFDPGDRRYGYPFLNCTHCGPRFSILRSLPYDRGSTAMAGFKMCADCRAEFENPADRRFHAQPIACPACGPHLTYLDATGNRPIVGDATALDCAAALLRGWGILALKGLGGFQLMIDARSERAVSRLRLRKQREAKPLAVMVTDRAMAADLVVLSSAELDLLASPMAPIMLARKRPGADIAEAVAPGLGELGVMLPTTPLHHLLMRRLGFPVVATSGNIAGAPMEVETESALLRLGGIADAFLVHDRPIERPVDDSLVRVVLGRRQILRRGRGFAPLPLPMPGAPSSSEYLALGGMLKNTVAYGLGGRVVVGGHIGDLDDPAAVRVHRTAAADLIRLFGAAPVTRRICCDLHPDYESTRTALELTATPVRVQHHLAHLAGVMAENELAPPVLGFVWDGAGFGLDGSIWGGECVLVEADGSVRRRATLRPFRVLGGDQAAREPRRVLLGMLGEIFGPGFGGLDWLSELGFPVQELVVLGRMSERGICAPWCCSMGRLFDAIAALSGLCLTNRFEGQAAMMLEGATSCGPPSGRVGGGIAPLPRIAVAGEFAGLPWAPEAWLDWGPLLERLLADGRPGPEEASELLHTALVATVMAFAEDDPTLPVVFSGGCFQNRRLLEALIVRLEGAGIQAFWNQAVPPNDGGLSYGQIAADRLLRFPTGRLSGLPEG